MAEDSDSGDDDVQCFKLIVRNLPQSVFIDASAKERLECLFLRHGIHATFQYMKSFRRVRVAFLSESQAAAARSAVHGVMFDEQILSVFRASNSLSEMFTSGKHLKPPKPQRMELISPPTSPPVGWVQTVEAPPIIDYQLQAAVASLTESGSVVELYDGGGSLPTINVTNCGD